MEEKGKTEKRIYEEMTKEELINSCLQKDNALKECIDQMQKDACVIYGKDDIINIYGCKDNKALSILKFLHQLKLGIKIGKEYYVTKRNHDDFLRIYQGKEVFV